MITKPYLIDEFRALGMAAGDTIFVHSAYSTLSRAPGGVEGGPQTVIDAILDVVGPEGTLIRQPSTTTSCTALHSLLRPLSLGGQYPEHHLGEFDDCHHSINYAAH
jgi:aminoglycoside N3'-acetyltransferase